VFEIGNSLRDARVRQGLELPELEIQTKIRAKYLKALEEEQFELLPGDSYVKGFLRTYAERLGLDGQLYVDEYNSRFALSEEPVVSSRPGRRSRQARAESHAVLVALVGIIAVTVLVIAAWRFGSSGDDGQSNDPSASVASTSPSTDTSPLVIPPAATDGQIVELLVTAANGPTVLEVHQGSVLGRLVWEGTLKKGQSQTFTGVELWLQVSRPANLEFKIDGTLVEGFTSRKPAVIVATADGVERAPVP
jgi:cytoskeletal protein RodZ